MLFNYKVLHFSRKNLLYYSHNYRFESLKNEIPINFEEFKFLNTTNKK